MIVESKIMHVLIHQVKDVPGELRQHNKCKTALLHNFNWLRQMNNGYKSKVEFHEIPCH